MNRYKQARHHQSQKYELAVERSCLLYPVECLWFEKEKAFDKSRNIYGLSFVHIYLPVAHDLSS